MSYCLTNLPDSVLNDIEEIFIAFYGMVNRTRSRDLLLSMNMKKGESKFHIFKPLTKLLKCHGFINYPTLSTIHHGKYFY
jgi:hypothetical protein